jgi:phosphinothricin acetyltransferase
MENPLIRAARPEDLPGILDIYNEVVENSTAIFALLPVTLDDRLAWFRQRREAGYPVMVALEDERVAGYSSFGEFRGAWSGYRYSVEHSVHVHRDFRGRGLGSALVRALLEPAAAMGKHVMIGAIDAANVPSLRLHDRLGFQQVGHFREVGHKFGHWLDLVFVQRFLDPPGSPRTA